MFYIAFWILNVIFIYVSLNNFVNFLVSFPLYVKVAYLFYAVLGQCLCPVFARLEVFDVYFVIIVM
jgi:hypothetical protein